MDEGGEWENEVWMDLWSERRIKLRFQAAGARPWILERRDGLARGVNYRLVAADSSSACRFYLTFYGV